jgi:acetyl esterase/lipase
LYLPAAAHFPTILFVHGGSLSTGDRQESPYSTVCRPIQRSGLGCASISYRLFPSVRWPEPERDVVASLAWLKTHIESRGGDPRSLFVAGHSSGCLLASLLASDPKYLREKNLSQTDVAGVIAIGCRLNDRLDAGGAPPEAIRRHFQTDPYDRMFGNLETLNDAVPLLHVGRGLPPMLVLMGDGEQFQPPILSDAKAFEAEARRTGGGVQIKVLPGRTHREVITRLGSPGDEALPAILSFVASISP